MTGPTLRHQLGLAHLPLELLEGILEYVDAKDAIAVSSLSRSLRSFLFDHVFDSAVQRRRAKKTPTKSVYWDLFLLATRTDSVNVLGYIRRRDADCDLTGLTARQLVQNTRLSYYHHAVVADAPRVALELLHLGADSDLKTLAGRFPDLAPLAAISMDPKLHGKMPALDVALRSACRTGMLRTVEAILAGGANPDTMNAQGVHLIHLVLSTRLKSRPSDEFESIRPSNSTTWSEIVEKTAALLLDFGASVRSTSSSARAHKCGYKCWRSIDCAHPGQTALHMAAAGGYTDTVWRLLKSGADTSARDGGGFTPLYYAIAQGHKYTALQIFNEPSSERNNPVVNAITGSTALHVACRFAVLEVITAILAAGAEPNRMDAHGRTPLDEVLGQTGIDREEDVVATLRLLASAGADPSISRARPDPWGVAATHTFASVRELFRDRRTNIWWEQLSSSSEAQMNARESIRIAEEVQDIEYWWGNQDSLGPGSLEPDVHFPAITTRESRTRPSPIRPHQQASTGSSRQPKEHHSRGFEMKAPLITPPSSPAAPSYASIAAKPSSSAGAWRTGSTPRPVQVSSKTTWWPPTPPHTPSTAAATPWKSNTKPSPPRTNTRTVRAASKASEPKASPETSKGPDKEQQHSGKQVAASQARQTEQPKKGGRGKKTKYIPLQL